MLKGCIDAREGSGIRILPSPGFAGEVSSSPEEVRRRRTRTGAPTSAERQLLDALARNALGYFLENQLPHGLILDRRRNRGPRSFEGLCSTAATGMGLMAVALAAAPEYRLLSDEEADPRGSEPAWRPHWSA